jgi:hypothetical protein
LEVDPAMAVTCRQLEPRHQPRPKSSASKSAAPAAVSSANRSSGIRSIPAGSESTLLSRRTIRPKSCVVEPQPPLSSYVKEPAA